MHGIMVFLLIVAVEVFLHVSEYDMASSAAVSSGGGNGNAAAHNKHIGNGNNNNNNNHKSSSNNIFDDSLNLRQEEVALFSFLDASHFRLVDRWLYEPDTQTKLDLLSQINSNHYCWACMNLCQAQDNAYAHCEWCDDCFISE